MVGTRRGPIRDGANAEQKSKIKVISSESPKKRRRKNEDIFAFGSDSECGDTPTVNGYGKRFSKGRLNGPPKRNEDGTQSMTNGGTPSRSTGTRDSKPSRKSSPSPVPSESSSDPLTSQRTPITPTKQPIQSPKKTQSSKRKSAVANNFDIPTIPTPATSFEKKLAAITKGSREKKLNQESTRPRKTVTFNDSRASSEPSVNAPKQGELESIKSYVLGKLCGRNPIPLTGKPAGLAEYIRFKRS